MGIEYTLHDPERRAVLHLGKLHWLGAQREPGLDAVPVAPDELGALYATWQPKGAHLLRVREWLEHYPGSLLRDEHAWGGEPAPWERVSGGWHRHRPDWLVMTVHDEGQTDDFGDTVEGWRSPPTPPPPTP